MKSMFSDKSKVKLLSKFQKNLILLNPNSSQETINKIFDIFPPNFLENKENLIIICKSFAMIPRRSHHMIFVTVKLFQKVLPYMKKYLQDESSIIWNLLGYIMFFKLWMYEEGLISIEHIVLSAMSANSSSVAEYFLPEIMEYNPELFHKEIKIKYKDVFNDENKYSKETIQQLKEKRKNYFNWILNSYDYCDPLYHLIETNSLRLSIKMDDIENFQKIISNSNLSLNMKIKESIIEAFVNQNNEINLFCYAIHYNSTKIIKFLAMNDIDFDGIVITYALSNGDYDLVHLIECKNKNEFEKLSFNDSVYYWHPKISHYILNNYNIYNQIFNSQKQIFSEDEKVIIKDILMSTFENCNIMFFKSKILPFLKQHDQYVRENIYHLICWSFKDMSCFFCKEFLKYEGIDINYVNEYNNTSETYLTVAVFENNSNAVEYLINNFPDIDVNTFKVNWCSPLYFASARFADMKIIKLLCNHPNTNINYCIKKYKLPVYKMALMKGNVIAYEFFIKNYKPILNVGEIKNFICYCLQNYHLLSAKLFLQFIFESKSALEISQIANDLANFILDNLQNSDNFINDFSHILSELL